MSRKIIIIETKTTTISKKIIMTIEETELDFIKSVAKDYNIEFDVAKTLYKRAQDINEFYAMCEEEAAAEAD